MAKTATINMRVNPEVKSSAESIFASLGMTLTEAINVFLHKSVMEGGLPFDVRQPRYNAETEAAMREARDIMSGKAEAGTFDSAAAMFAALDEQGRHVPEARPHIAVQEGLQEGQEARAGHARAPGCA